MSGRSRSLATTVFFEAELLGVNEVPHRSVVDLEAALGQLRHQPAQREGALADASARKTWCSPAIAFGLCPPIWPGATLPVCRKRRTQPTTVLTPTPNCAAARCRDSPPCKTAPTTRSRRSIE